MLPPLMDRRMDNGVVSREVGCDVLLLAPVELGFRLALGRGTGVPELDAREERSVAVDVVVREESLKSHSSSSSSSEPNGLREGS